MRERSVSKSKVVRALLVVGILFGFAVFDSNAISRVFRGVIQTVLWPFEQAFSSVSVSARDVVLFLSSISELKQENERLSEENLRLLAENSTLLFLRDENETLRRDSGLDIRKKFELLATEVIASGGEAQRGSVVINRGTIHGVEVGMPAIVGDGLLVGVVDEVYPASARVALVTNSKMALGGITAESGSKGIVRGDRGLGVLYGMVLQSDALHEGDRVMTSGAGGTIPSGLYIGSIATIRTSGDRLFREATIVSPVNHASLRFLFLVQNGVKLKP